MEGIQQKCLKLAHPTRFERVTFAFGGQRSIQLSYGCIALHLPDWPGVGNGGKKRNRDSYLLPVSKPREATADLDFAGRTSSSRVQNALGQAAPGAGQRFCSIGKLKE